ncbi:hypothetical protein D8B24_19340 [Verminephrobacter aporrectodeae subsp. tuberculatae]|uniref:Ig-like domain-containing protein n=1 Tax=Verminephrobacter aporrectodeae TaxID=1110389 RepID=UPI002244726A|nr:Ig-like domain-containing protein [Verminephrobacter aporrectodeae]MCW8209122.1 hypothetical protein [Verminephrobacter aporrectodeae subsp. tuberculatae]
MADTTPSDTTPREPNRELDATITIADSALTAGETTTVTFTFSEPVNGLDTGDISCTNGTLSRLTANAEHKIWTATFTPTTNINAPSNVLNVNLAGVTDNAGNPGEGEATSANYSVDTRDTVAPLLHSATVNDNQLVLSYTDANMLDASHTASASAFALSSSSDAAISVSSVAVTGKTVTLTLSRAVTSDEALTLSYTKPATGEIQDEAGNDAADLHNQVVDNRTPEPKPDVLNADNDGVPDAQENQAIGPTGAARGDGNADGTQDSAQAAVASFSATINNSSSTSVTLVADSQDGKLPLGSNTRITSLEQKAAPAQTPQALETPIALTSFKATLETAGSTETFSLYVDPKIGANGYWLQDHGGTWVNLASSPYGGKMVDEGGRLRLDFTITDGGAFDADGQANGSISAPGAAAQMPLSIVGQASDGAHDGFWF